MTTSPTSALFASLWKIGTPIDKARLQFAPEALIVQLGEAPKVSALNWQEAVMRTTGRTNTEVLALMKGATDNHVAQTATRQAILHEIDQNFLRMIRASELRCFGFEFPRKLASKPVEMLPEHWTQWPDWEKGEFQASGIHLGELRVVRSSEVTRSRPDPVVGAPGRPNFDAAIQQAFWALHAKDLIVIKPVSTSINRVRVWIRENLPETKAAKSILSDDTIRKALVPLLAALTAEKVEKL